MNRLRDLAERPEDPRRPAAAWELTICYFSGFGVTRDFNAALKWLSEARNLGVAAAQDFFQPLQEAIVVALKNQTRDGLAFVEKQRHTLRNQQSSTNTISNVQNNVLGRQSEDNGASTTIGEKNQALTPTRSAFHPTDESDTVQNQGIVPDPNTSFQRYLEVSNANPQSTPSIPLPVPSHVRDAITTGSVHQLRHIITSDPSLINSADEWGNTPLLLSAHHKQLEVLRYLISHPDINASAHNKYGQTALHFLAHFEDEHVVDFVLPLVNMGTDLFRDALPMRKDSGALILFHGLRCCAVLNSILHNKTILLTNLLEAAHSKPSIICQICEAGSRFRRILAVALSLFRIDVLELLMAHLRTHRKSETINLANVKVWAGQKLLRLDQVPFSSVAVSAMDLPEDFFRAIMYGSNYADVLERTLDFLTAMASTGDKSNRNPDGFSLETKMLSEASAAGSLDSVSSLLNRMEKSQTETPEWVTCWNWDEDGPLGTSVQFGLRDIFDRLLRDNASFLQDKFDYPCQITTGNCLDDPSWWVSTYRQLLGRHTRIPRPDGHTHSLEVIGYLLKLAIRARHQDTYFL